MEGGLGTGTAFQASPAPSAISPDSLFFHWHHLSHVGKGYVNSGLRCFCVAVPGVKEDDNRHYPFDLYMR